MNLIGGPNRSVIDGVLEAIGASFSDSSTVVTDPGIGPTPDDPVIVTWGAL
jgi:molybdopterin-biosynthesis enzyme MoeA-like protein